MPESSYHRKKSPYKDLLIPANNQHHHLLAKGTYWSQHVCSCNLQETLCIQFYLIPSLQRNLVLFCIFIVQKLVSSPQKHLDCKSETADLVCHHHRKRIWAKLSDTSSVQLQTQVQDVAQHQNITSAYRESLLSYKPKTPHEKLNSAFALAYA